MARSVTRTLLRWAAALSPFAIPPAFLLFNNDVFNLDSAAIIFTSSSFVALGCLWVLLARVRIASPGVAFGLCAAAIFWLFLIALVGSLLSNKLWADNLSYEIVGNFLQRPGAALGLTPLRALQPAWQKAAVALSAAAISMGIFLAVYRATRRARPTKLLSAVAAFFLALYMVATVYVQHAAPSTLRGEPLSSFFMIGTSGSVGWESDRVAAALEDRETANNYPTVSRFDKRNVVLILVEFFRPDHLDFAGYDRPTTPFLSRLMDSGKLTLIETAHSTCSELFCGIASTLASRPYHEISRDNFKLNSVLRRNGYNVQYNVAGDHRTWRFLWDFYGDDIDAKIDPVARNDTNEADDRSMIANFKSVKSYDGTPFFFYFFLMSTHFLTQKDPEFVKYQPSEFDRSFLSRFYGIPPTSFDGHGVPQYPAMSPEERGIYRNRYDNGVLQADAMIREIFETLDAKGYLKDSIIVIAGDHGESLGERGHILHARHLYEKDIKIPLMVYDDRGLKLANSSYASHLDIAPTILARLGLPRPLSWKGRSLTEPLRPTLTVHQTRLRERMCVAVLDKTETGLVKYIQCVHKNGTRSEELFDLIADRDETENIVDSSPPRLASYREIASRRLRVARCGGDGQSVSCEIFSR